VAGSKQTSATVVGRFAETSASFAALVRAIAPDQWDGPGLGEWSLRSLVGHASRSLITVDTYLDQPAESVAVDSAAAYYAAIVTGRAGNLSSAAVTERGRQAGLALGDDPAGHVDALLARVLTRVDQEDDPLITTILGGMRLHEYLRTRVLELVVHGLDISASAGLDPPDYSTEALREVAELSASVAVLTGRGPELILALTGRAPLPAGFSVV
jgi:uncharacterized protein (TIGR03083 family)